MARTPMINLVEMHAAPGHRDEFIAFCKAWIPSALTANCARVELPADARDALPFVLVEHWPSADAMVAFMKSEFADEAQLAKYQALTTGGLPALRQFRSLAQSAA